MTETSQTRRQGGPPPASGLFAARLAELAEQKRQLVAHGEVQRALIDLHLAAARESVPLLGTAERFIEWRSRWLPLVAVGAGLVMATRARGMARWFKAAVAVLPLAKRFL